MARWPRDDLVIARLVHLLVGFRLELVRLVLRRFLGTDYEVAVAHELDPRVMRLIRDVLPEAEARVWRPTAHHSG